MAQALRADGGKAMSYTNTPNNVEDEAEGKKRADGGAAAPAARASGGVAASATAARANGGRLADGGEAAAAAAPGRKRGGAMKHVAMEGMKTKHRRLDRPGRKRGGGVGADATPLTTAAKTTQAGDHKADADELAR